MGSFKGNGREDGSKRRPGDLRRRRQGQPSLESLEERRLLTTPGSGPIYLPTSTNPLDVQHGPLASLGSELIQVYKDYVNYENAGGKGPFVSSQAKRVFITGTNVGIDAKGYGNFSTYVQALQGLGMTVNVLNAKYEIAEGNIPIASLPQLAALGQSVDAAPIYRPSANQQGISPNQADATLNGPLAKTTYGLTGAGQKVGVLSNTINQFGTGLAGSVASGDLPSDVQVLNDGPAGSDDEGRAMLEQIYDIAPGAKLAYATAFTGELAFAQNINALFNVGAGTIVDDVTYFDEPYYQDGVISQAVNTVVAAGGTYLSSAANDSDGGYESDFRGVNATVGPLGAGRYLNFDPSGATTTTQLGFIVSQFAAPIFMQFDQPYYTTSGVTSNVEIDILDANGNLVTSGNSNTIATQQPFQITAADLTPGLYTAVVKVNSGPDPGHVFIYNESNSTNVSFDHKFGSAGNTYYPTTHGHNAAPNTISVGAVPYYGAPPYLNPSPVTSEPFSSTGPVVQVFDTNGNRIAPTVYQKPDISGADGNNTSFFGLGPVSTTQVVATANTPYPGNSPTTFDDPTTPTNDNVGQLLSFYGTSSAAPNVAAVVALMKQAVPGINNATILSSLKSTATPLNGAAKGVFNAQGGFGLVNAAAAIAVASVLKVQFISPGAGQTVTATPTYIQVQFNKPVVLATISPNALKVNGPNGSTVTVGKPFGFDDPVNPTFVRFPITITPAPGRIANGFYQTLLFAGTVTSTSGQVLQQGVADGFNLAVASGPQIVATSFAGRIVQVKFSEPVQASTVNTSTLILFRNGGVTAPTFGPLTVLVSTLTGAIFSYNPSTLTATIDLTNVPQAQLPTDHYGLLATSAITDSIGLPLNGQFNGVFPSGVFPSGSGSNFFQDLGIVVLQPPKISFLNLTAASDTGIAGDANTNNNRPAFIGQVVAQFPTSLAGDLVYVEFNGISHQGVARGGIDLNVGANGRGFIGQFDVQTTTDANGQFIINYPAGVSALPEGENTIRVVVVGQADQPPFPGFSSTQDSAFRIDNTLPYVGTTDGTQATTIAENSNINALANLSINIVDPVNPMIAGDPFKVDTKIAVPALNPAQAENISNYVLYRFVNGVAFDESSFISRAKFVSTSARTSTTDPYTGRVDLTFAPGLPTGRYSFYIVSSGVGLPGSPAGKPIGGISDAAGNPFGGTQGTSSTNTPFDFQLDFNLQPTPTYITGYTAYSPNANATNGFDQTDVRANYEIAVPGITPRAPVAPTLFTLDFSNTLVAGVDYSNVVQVVRSANSATANPDGDFGDLGITNTFGYTRVTGLAVYLANSVPGAVFGQYGYNNRLVIQLPAGATLPADYYRLYLPNNGPTAITDIFGNQLDGEFKGYQNAVGTYVDLLPNGQIRGSTALPDLSGDGTSGGAFVTGFVVVPNGNIIYARADAVYNPQVAGQTPTGAFDKPYSVLAPEAVFTNINGGDLNSVVNSGANFNSVFDRSGDGRFEPSAFYAAQQRVQVTGGPAVIIAESSIPSRDPSTGSIIQKPFVLEAPAGSDPVANDASASIPALTTLVLDPAVILKMQNASLFVQNQGSALQILGGPNSYQTVTITSYKDSTVGGVSNGDPSTVGTPGDFGGIVFRNFSQAAIPGTNTPRSTTFPGQISATGNALLDGRLKGRFISATNPGSQVDAVSGADDVMSYINFLTERYAGGVVPQTVGIRYDGITLKNSRPTIINSSITDTNGNDGSAQAGISVDVDSLRADDTAQGPLFRNDTFLRNGLNGIYIRAEVSSGIAEATNAIVYPTNPSTLGGSRNYILDNPYPYLLTTRLVIGQSLIQETGGGQATGTADRLNVIPGMVLKFEHGSALQVNSGRASINVGDSTYIKEYDANHNVGPIQSALLPNGQPNPTAGQATPGFVPNSPNLAQVIFTSLNDDAATTSFFDPISKLTTTIVQALAAVPGGSGALQPTPTLVPDAARWGNVTVTSGAVAVFNSVIFRYGGGAVNSAAGTAGGPNPVLSIGGGGAGARISVTNNLFNSNLDVPINLQPDSLLAADPTRPLVSGAPFIHGNVFTNNGYNGVGVQGGTGGVNRPNLHVNSVWPAGDFTYILRDTIVLDGQAPSLDSIDSKNLQAIPTPAVSLTLQSTLPGTILADGTVVPAPGISLIIKLQNVGSTPLAETPGVNPPTNTSASYLEGASFIVGVDDGTDPPTATPGGEPAPDPGAFSQIRILGIGANQTTGQTRVPVVITSIHDNSYGTTVNNVPMFRAITGDTAPAQAGDGGVIYFGGNSLTDYDLQDPRSGSLIDNADIKYITRVEQQGGGIIYTYDLTGANSFTPAIDDAYGTKLGYTLGLASIAHADQLNQAKQVSISNSNLSNFSDVGFRAHPGYSALGVAGNYVVTNQPYVFRLSGYLGEATHSYLVNDTFSNMPNAIDLISEVSSNTGFPSPAMAVILNNTFYNITNNAITSTAPVFDGTNSLSHVSFLVMDSIFSKIGVNAVQAIGQDYGSDLQYNLFDQVSGRNAIGVPNNQPVSGSPAFRNADAGNFFLLANSAAIDVARSELGPSIFGDMLYPAATIDPNNLNAIPIRNALNQFALNPIVAGDVNPFGGIATQGFFGPGIGIGFGTDQFPFAEDIVTLPGEPVSQRGFPDQWIPVLASAGTGYAGTGTNAGTFVYAPLSGERDQAGNLRVKDPNSPNVGFGSRPFFDLGAFEYIIQNPPLVTGVNAVSPDGTKNNLYKANGIAGTNKSPSSIQVTFSERLDTTTITGASVILIASGGDGIFGNTNDRAINLAGLLSFDPTSNTLTIDTSSILANPATLNDEYMLTLKGAGSAVIRDRSGLALDGFTANDTLPLPSGSDNFPGSDFAVTFTISTHSPSILPGTFHLAPSSDTSGGLSITKNNLPTFVGSITDTFPPINAVSGQSVHIDISSKGDGVFDLIDAGLGTTDASGNFSITLTKPIPDTPNPIGTDGIRGDTGANYAIARVRVINQAGNPSDLPTDPLSAFQAKGAVAFFQVDTKLPQITAFSPLANTLATVNANGQVVVSVTFNENIKGASLNPNSIQVFRSGGTGTFTGTGVVAVPINQGSFTVQYLKDATGSEKVTFSINGPLPNDAYEIILKGTGANPVTDLAGNPLSGAYLGVFPTGGTSNQGSDFVNIPFTVYQSTSAHLIYVQAPSFGTISTGVGTRANPYTTIAKGMAAALIGDDVLVLPGTYKEDVVVKPGVRLLSASLSSTDNSFLPGVPNQTLIYGVPTATNSSYINTVTVTGAIFGVPTEVSGFAIISPLFGDPSLGVIDPTNDAIKVLNSNVLIDRNIIVNAGVGVFLATSGANAATAQVFDNVIAGNIVGVGITDSGSTSSLNAPFQIVNNTITDNTIGLNNSSNSIGTLQAYVLNNIFYSNHDLTTARNGTGIQSNTANTLGVGFNLFFANGASNTNPASNATGIFGAFVPSALTSKPDALGNFIGNPAFVTARDPRPNGDTPAVFFLDSNYDLTGQSVAINAANNSVAPATDILYRTPVKIAGKGFTNTGPASIGAYYYLGTGGPPTTIGTPVVPGTGTGTGTGTGSGKTNPVASNAATVNALSLTMNGTTLAGVTSSVGNGLAIGTKKFSVVNTSLSSLGTASASDIYGTTASLAAPNFIDINFSDDIDRASISANDLVLTGSGLDAINPAKATGLAWIDDHAVRFILSGSFANNGTVNLSIPSGALTDSNGDKITGFTDSFQVASGGASTAPTSTVVALAQPVAVAGPVSVAAAALAHPAKHHPAKVAHAAKKEHHVTVKPAHHEATAKHAKAKVKPKKTK